MTQGSFDGENPDEIHRYKFLFPNNADKVTITLAVGRPPNSKSYLRSRLLKIGSKTTSNISPNQKIGDPCVRTTHKAVYEVKRGGKGVWPFEIHPYFDKNIGSNRAIRTDVQ